MIAIFGTPNSIKIALTTKEFRCVTRCKSNCFSASQRIRLVNQAPIQLK